MGLLFLYSCAHMQGVMVCSLPSLVGCWKGNHVLSFPSNHFLSLQVSLITVLNVQCVQSIVFLKRNEMAAYPLV